MPIAIPIAIVAAKLISGLLKHKGESAANQAAHDAAVNQLTLNQKMGEDKRIAKLGAGQSILNSIKPNAAAGGRIDYGDLGFDPTTMAGLQKERTYDFSKAVTDPSKGAGWNFAGSTLGSAADAVGSAYGTGAIGGAAGLAKGLFDKGSSVPTTSQGYQPGALGGQGEFLNGGYASSNSFNPLGGLSGTGAPGSPVTSGAPAGTIPSTAPTLDELLKKQG